MATERPDIRPLPQPPGATVCIRCGVPLQDRSHMHLRAYCGLQQGLDGIGPQIMTQARFDGTPAVAGQKALI